MVSPDSQASACPLSGRNSTYRPVKISGAGSKDYFRRLNKEIDEGGAEAMFYDLSRKDLGDWHPRNIPEELLKGEALQKQQGFSLPPIEQWFLLLLHDGVLRNPPLAAALRA
jgi:hypothetical protein